MSKRIGELDWSEDLKKSGDYKHTPTALWAADMYGGGKEGVDPLNKSEKRIKDGEAPRKPTDKEISDAVMYNAPQQPTDEEMFGQFVVTEEMAKKAEKEWTNRSNNAFDKMKANIITEEDKDEEWANGESFNKSLSRTELEKRNMFTGE